jgi:signal transduction histidine kinase
LEEKEVALRDTKSEMERYSHSVSHDLRAPLRAMQGYANILIEDAPPSLSEEYRRFLVKIDASARRLENLIQDVLSYNRVYLSEVELKPVDLTLLINDVIEHYPGMQPPDALINIVGKIPLVLGTGGLLTQCISNLLANAVKFVAPGVVPRVEIWSELVNENVIISFVDNGIGIAPNDLDRIFGIFIKVHPAETYPGSGIGLSIVKKAAQRLGGKVGATSTLGEGSRFWLRLKAAPG